MADVTKPELAGHHRLGAAKARGDRAGHLAYRVRFAAGNVVGPQSARLPGGQRREVGRRYVTDMHEVPPLRTVLEDPWRAPYDDMFQLTVAPEAAPDRPEEIEIELEAGVPVAVDGTHLSPAALLAHLLGTKPGAPAAEGAED